MQILAFLMATIASYYDMPGSVMANGQPYNPWSHTCATLYEPFGEKLEITNTDNGASSWCVVTDRGPFVSGRGIDVSLQVRNELQMGGLANVRIYRVTGYVPKCTRKPRPQTCKAPPPHLCVLDLPRPALLKCG